VVTFLELAPDSGEPDDERLGGRTSLPPWLIRACYFAVLALIVGALVAGDGSSLAPVISTVATPPAPAAGYVYADRGHCPLTVSCEVIPQSRIDLWWSYNQLFPDSQRIASSVWYAPASGIVYYQELDAIGARAETIILTQQRLSGPDVPFGPTIDRSPNPRHGAVVTAQRGPWLVTASLFTPHGVPPVLAAAQWVVTSPLPG
jgi:hypothetical protein